MSNILYISEIRVRELLNWEETLKTIELSLKCVSQGRAIQEERSITKLPDTNNLLFSMPGYLQQEDFKSLACKLVTSFPDNYKRKLPSILANILLLDETTGELQAIIAGTEITSWRTAAASAVATKYLHQRSNNILAILGTGTQAKIHAIAFQRIFNFDKVHIYSRKLENAVKLTSELTAEIGDEFFLAFDDVEQCVKNADVIITTTFATSPILKYEWLKQPVHINAIGTGKNVQELEEKIYKNSFVYVDHLGGIENELATLKHMGIQFAGEIGALIDGTLSNPETTQNTIFQSLGMAVEDCAMARMVYNKHIGLPPI